MHDCMRRVGLAAMGSLVLASLAPTLYACSQHHGTHAAPPRTTPDAEPTDDGGTPTLDAASHAELPADAEVTDAVSDTSTPPADVGLDAEPSGCWIDVGWPVRLAHLIANTPRSATNPRGAVRYCLEVPLAGETYGPWPSLASRPSGVGFREWSGAKTILARVGMLAHVYDLDTIDAFNAGLPTESCPTSTDDVQPLLTHRIEPHESSGRCRSTLVLTGLVQPEATAVCTSDETPFDDPCDASLAPSAHFIEDSHVSAPDGSILVRLLHGLPNVPSATGRVDLCWDPDGPAALGGTAAEPVLIQGAVDPFTASAYVEMPAPTAGFFGVYVSSDTGDCAETESSLLGGVPVPTPAGLESFGSVPTTYEGGEVVTIIASGFVHEGDYDSTTGEGRLVVPVRDL